MAKRTVTVELEEGEILLALQRPEGYEDTHPELLVEDARLPAWLEYRIVPAESSPVASGPATLPPAAAVPSDGRSQ